MFIRTMVCGKIHKIKVTDACLDYEGSITVDWRLLNRASIREYEQVHVLNVTNGQRFVTYAINGDLGEVCVNGAAARKVSIGDELIILSYVQMSEVPSNYHPIIVRPEDIKTFYIDN